MNEDVLLLNEDASGSAVSRGTGKTRNEEGRNGKWEMRNDGNGKREMKKWAFSFIVACPLAFFWSGLLPQELAEK